MKERFKKPPKKERWPFILIGIIFTAKIIYLWKGFIIPPIFNEFCNIAIFLFTSMINHQTFDEKEEIE